MQKSSDFIGLVKGTIQVLSALAKEQRSEVSRIWKHYNYNNSSTDLKNYKNTKKISKHIKYAENKSRTQKEDLMNKLLYSTESVLLKDTTSPIYSVEEGKLLEQLQKVKKSRNNFGKESTFPASNMIRLSSFASVVAGVGLERLRDYTLGFFGFTNSTNNLPVVDSMLQNPKNAERFVKILCKTRGVALKTGQVLSMQGNNVISPEFQKIFEKVRMSADFMPPWQVEKVLNEELGKDWKNNFLQFDMKPISAASIGQVHLAFLNNGKRVAVKVQYPELHQTLDSDIKILGNILQILNFIPKGQNVRNVWNVTKRDISYELNYLQEAESIKIFGYILRFSPEFYVPKVLTDFSTKRVLTMEFVEGITVDKCSNFPEDERNYICKKILKLYLQEAFQYRFMQTDPNWSNFLYNPNTGIINLVDFGACHSYNRNFIDKYISLIKNASDGNIRNVYERCHDIGFLEGTESKIMVSNIVKSFLTVGELFRDDEYLFDFYKKSVIVQEIQNLVPVLITNTHAKPPEEIYSMHRKLCGILVLFMRLKAKVPCREMFLNVYQNYKI